MLLKPITIAAAGLAAATQAFLLPPEVSESDIKVVNTIDALPDSTRTRVIELACPGCPVRFLGKEGKVHVKADKPNHLLLAFSIDKQSGSDRLLLNDYELYPIPNPAHGQLLAPQVVDFKGHDWHKEHHEGVDGAKSKERKHKDWNNAKSKHHRHRRPILSPQLGFGMEVHPAVTAPEDQFQMISMDLQIMWVGSDFVSGIPNVHIDLLEDTSGNLMIAGIETTSTNSLNPSDEKQQECATMFCKWLSAVKDKFKDMKGFRKHCHGNKQGAAEVDPQRTHNHHGGRPRPNYHSWRQLMKSIASHILLPVFIGIVAGVSVSLIGMVFGTLIVSLWRFFFRRPSRRHAGHSHHRAAQKEAAVAEEKTGLMDHQDPPPEYRDEEPNKDSVQV